MARNADRSNGEGQKASGNSDSGPERRSPNGPPAEHRPAQSPGGVATGPRPLPHSAEAEKALLCSILHDPRELAPLCIDRLGKEPFYSLAHQTVYEVIVELWDAGRPIDMVTLGQEITDRGLLEKTGGTAELSRLFDYVPSAANASYYLEIVRDKAVLRNLIRTCNECVRDAHAEDGADVAVLLDEAESRIFSIREGREARDVVTMEQHVVEAMAEIEECYENRGRLNGLASGFTDLDEMTSGLHPGEMVIIAARPSMGKTALAMTIAEHVSVDLQKPVAVFSLEMSSKQLVQRLLCSRARVDLKRVRSGQLHDRDFPRLTNAMSQLHGARMYIDDSAGLTVLELRARARRLMSRFGLKLIVIDYMQLLRSQSRRAQENRQIEISEISAGVKALAKELSIPIIVLSQLNREPDKRGGGKPRLSDLRESGSIEQDADVVMLLMRPEMYAEEEDKREEDTGKAEIIVAKQRNGPTGEVKLTFLKEFTRFENMAKVAED